MKAKCLDCGHEEEMMFLPEGGCPKCGSPAWELSEMGEETADPEE